MTREGYISVGEAATLLGVSRQTVHNRLKAGKYRYESVLEGKQERYDVLEEDVRADIKEPSSGHQLAVKPERLDSPHVADLSRYLWGTLEIIEKQLQGKDQIIATLEKESERKDKTIERLQEAIVKLAEKQHENQRSWWQRWW